MVVGSIIGASIFVQPSEITSQVPSIPGVLLVWCISGMLTLCGALVCAELASMFTKSGGVYVYLKEAFSPALGFLWGWAMFWVMHSGIIAAIPVVFARYVAYFAPMGDVAIDLVAVSAIVIVSAVNYVGVKQASTLQALFTLGKLVAIAFIIVLGFALDVGNLSLAVGAGLFAFGGWHMETYNAEETVDPRRTIPRALATGTVIVTVCYVAMNAVYLYVLPLETVARSTRVAADAADAVAGFGGGAIMSGLVIFSTCGALSGIVLSGPRVYFSMARDGLLFDWLGRVHPRYRTPHRSILLQAVWASVLVVTGTYRTLFTRVIYTEWIFFGLMAIGLIVLRRRDDLVRAYSVWGYPIVPGAFAAASFIIAINHIVLNPRDSLVGLALVLIGLPVHRLWSGWRAGRGPGPAASGAP